MLPAKPSPWLSAWLAHEMLLAHFPVLFRVSFQQDELHPGMANGENPVAVLGLGSTELPLSTNKPCPDCGWNTVQEKKATSP